MTTPTPHTGPAPAESGIVIRLHNVETATRSIRQAHDPQNNIPSHITVLYPWIPPHHITINELHRLAEITHTHTAFTGTLATIEHFPGDVTYLAPEPHHQILHLIHTIQQAYPNYPPYEGRYEHTIPHFTIAQETPPATITTELATLTQQLPLPIHINNLEVLCSSPNKNTWHTLARYTLPPE